MTRGKKSKTTKAGPPKNVTVSTRERQANYVETLLENKRFEEYYRNMGILNDRDFDIFMNALRLPLPVSFRITGSKQHATQLRDYMRNSLFPKLSNVVVDGKAIPPPETVDWYPDELAFVYDIGRGALKKCEAAQELHKFLVAENEVGNICRQEIVSMIPVRFLDVRPSQSILDMCAAPGSKTTQLLEGIMTESNEFPDGIVIANDSDQKRAYTLVHQAKRLQTPTLLVTNHDAQVFPRILVKSDRAEKSALLFDRVLCDVPCSGDGTMRKNKAIWKSWQANNGLGLHRTQRNILLRGLELLKVDGLLVYSTCSFNPVENEAVIASVLEETGDCFELVDIGEQLPTLKRYPGISTWKVLSNDGTFNLEYAPNLPGIQKTMFPPKNIENFGMDRCMRFYPFLFNGGGFFVAVIRKKKEFGKVDNFNTTQITKSAKRKHYLSENTKEDFDVRNFKVGNRTELINGEAPFVWAPADTKAVKGCMYNYLT